MNTEHFATTQETNAPDRLGWWPELGVFAAAVLGRLPAMGAWWQQGDWAVLARTAGLGNTGDTSGWPARWLSEQVYWDLTWPLFGLNSDAHSLIRLILHGLAALLVVRIARRGGLKPLSGLVAGLIFAASPLAFAPLYTALGIGQILTAVLSLAAIERWLAGATQGRRPLAWATALVACAVMSGNAGLGLPLLMLGMVWLGVGVRLEDKAFAWAMIMFQLLAAVVAGVLFMTQLAAAAGQPVGPASTLTVLQNLGTAGWWLVSPGPIVALEISAPMMVAGGVLFGLWTAWGVFMMRRRSPLVLLTLCAALLALAPGLPISGPMLPRIAYLAVAPLGLMFGAVADQIRSRRWEQLNPLLPLAVLTMGAVAWGFLGMETRLSRRDHWGLVADPVARATALSWQGCQTIRNLKDHPGAGSMQDTGLTHLTLLQPLVTPATAQLAQDMGERWTQPSDIFKALGGADGPRLILGAGVQVNWLNGLTAASDRAVVLCETDTGFRMWGRTSNALLYAGLTDVGLGHFERARAHLKRAAALNKEQVMFIYDEGQMVIPMQMVLDNKEHFIDWTIGLLDEGVSRLEVAGLQDLYFNLLKISTGQSIEKLTSGSRLLSQPRDPAPSR